MLKKKLLRAYTLVALCGLPAVLASVPRSRDVTNDTAIYQDLHEIGVHKVKNVSFDADIKKLSAQEKSHHEALPVRLTGPMGRAEKAQYVKKSKRGY
jgi:hypothetical protein